MKFTGVVRRVDDLGRIVIPREIRKRIGLDPEGGDPMEIWLNDRNEVVLKRYQPEPEEAMRNALHNALDFLEELPSPPVDIINEINKALDIE